MDNKQMHKLKKLLFITLACVTLTGCSKTPEAWMIRGGMTKEEVKDVLEKEDLSYTESETGIDVESEIEYLDQTWYSMDVTFNEEEKVDKVSFYHSTEESTISKYALVDVLTKQLGEPSSSFGALTTWSEEDKWLVTFADNEAPFSQTLTYWYSQYMLEKDREQAEN